MTKAIPIDERRDLIVPGDKDKTIKFCVDHLIDAAQEAINDHGFFSIALSGGSTPKAIYSKLASHDYINRIDWSKVLVFFSDERSVPPDHEESNYKMAMDYGFRSIPLPSQQMYRMVAEENIDQNAFWYENKIREVLGSRPFDYIMLGMGDDGHTASLFPKTNALAEKDHLVVANYVSQKKTWRMTFTYPLINAAKQVVLYVIGESKSTMLDHVLHDKDASENYPSARVGTKEHKALWIADRLAAKTILPIQKTA